MNGMKYLFLLAYIIYFGNAIMMLYPPTSRWLITFRNSIMGMKTEITPRTILFNQIMGLIALVFGIFHAFIFFSYFN